MLSMLERVARPARAGARALGLWAAGSPRAAAGAALLGLAAAWAVAAVGASTGPTEAERRGQAYQPPAEAPATEPPPRHDVYIGFANLPEPSPQRRLDADEPVRRLRAIEIPQRRAVAAAPAPEPASILEPAAPRASTEPQPAPRRPVRRAPAAWIPPGEFLESPLAGVPSVSAVAGDVPVVAAGAPVEPAPKPVPIAAIPVSQKPNPVPGVVPAAPKPGSPAPVKPAVKPLPVAVAEPIAKPRPLPVAVPEPIAKPKPVAVAEPIARPKPVAVTDPIRPGPVTAAPGPDIVIGRNHDVARPATPPVALPAHPASPIGGSVAAALGDVFAIGDAGPEAPGFTSRGGLVDLRPIFLFAVGEDVVLVPEPGTLLLLGGGILGLGFAARRR
jgi:hypothetical protein